MSAFRPKQRKRLEELSPTLDEKHTGTGLTEGISFLGKPLNHAYFPNWNLRLFKHKLGRYEKITDLSTDSGDHEIHEHVVVQGTTGKLSSIMDHTRFRLSIALLKKHNRYSNWEAVVESSLLMMNPLCNMMKLRKAQITQNFPQTTLSPYFSLPVCLFWQRGIFDGWEGYVFARLHAQYEFLSLAKAKAILRNRKETG